MIKNRQYFIFIFSFLCLSLCLLDCTAEKTASDKVIIRSFYHWKTDFQIDEKQDQFLEELQIKEIYLHLFDVVWTGQEAEPTAVSSLKQTVNQVINPVVYITTDVFQNLDSIQIQELAEKVAIKIKKITEAIEINEVQFDCDWFPSIRDKYFLFLKEVKKHFPETCISSTVRLYQYKYPNLGGVPPADKVTLMYYNMGGLTKFEEENSILNNAEGFQYLGFGKYPLPLDVALPNFEWNAVFRAGKFKRLTTDFNELSFRNKELFKKIEEHKFAFKIDTVIGDFYYRFGDVIRFENCEQERLEAAAQELLKEINQDTTRIIFYDLRKQTRNDYEKLDAVFTIFE